MASSYGSMAAYSLYRQLTFKSGATLGVGVGVYVRRHERVCIYVYVDVY